MGYYEKRDYKHQKSQMDIQDEQESLRAQEVAAKKGKRDRILESMRERRRKSDRTVREMRSKKVVRETALKKQSKQLAEKRLRREKAKEAHDKRMARMKSAYNEGYFKAKGVQAEKKLKEKKLKALRKQEKADKQKRVIAAQNRKKA